MVQDAAAGGVPLAMKGVVVGISTTSIDIVWDRPFMGGETLNGRCSEYRGSTVPFSACLNLTRPQFAVGFNTNNNGANAGPGPKPFHPQLGPRPAIAPNHYQPAIPSNNRPVTIMRNTGSGRGQQNGSGPMQYGNAVKGVRPPPAQVHAPVSQQDRLHSALTGRQGASHVVHHKSPTKPTHPLPSVSGRGRGRGGGGQSQGLTRQISGDAEGAGTQVMGAPYRGGRGRGGGGGRGGIGSSTRGRGRGGAAAPAA